MPLLCGLRILKRLAGIFEISAGILAVGIEEQAIEALIQIVMDGDVALGASPVVALVKTAKRHARHIERLDPQLTFLFGEIARPKLQQAVKVAFGDDNPSVHVKFAQAQRRIEHQLPFGRTIKKLDAKKRTRAVAEGLNSAVGGFDLKPTFANQPSQICFENRVHRATRHPGCTSEAVPSRAGLPCRKCVNLGKVPRRFQVLIRFGGHSRNANHGSEVSCFSPIRAAKFAARSPLA